MGVFDLKSGPHEAYIDLQIAAYWELERNGTTEGLEFDELNHTFTANGQTLPSVTQVLRANGMTPEFYTRIDPWYLERGKLIHLATEYDDRGTLDEDTVDEVVRPYLDAYRTFRADYRGQITGIEKRMWHPQLGYAGIIDRTITGRICYSLHLKPGKQVPYKLIEVKDVRGCFNFFLSALNVVKWREQNMKEDKI
jgi:hypothetical protein